MARGPHVGVILLSALAATFLFGDEAAAQDGPAVSSSWPRPSWDWSAALAAPKWGRALVAAGLSRNVADEPAPWRVFDPSRAPLGLGPEPAPTLREGSVIVQSAPTEPNSETAIPGSLDRLTPGTTFESIRRSPAASQDAQVAHRPQTPGHAQRRMERAAHATGVAAENKAGRRPAAIHFVSRPKPRRALLVQIPKQASQVAGDDRVSVVPLPASLLPTK